MFAALLAYLVNKPKKTTPPKTGTKAKRRPTSAKQIAQAMRAVIARRLNARSQSRRPKYPWHYARKAAEAAAALTRKRMSPLRKNLLHAYLKDMNGARPNVTERLLADKAAMGELCRQPTWTLNVLEQLQQLETHAESFEARSFLIQNLVEALTEGKRLNEQELQFALMERRV